jgi:hypothetical protein
VEEEDEDKVRGERGGLVRRRREKEEGKD